VEGTNAARGFFNSIPVARMMVKLMGSGAYTKEIPSFFENAPDDVLLGFLEGYASGDGGSGVEKPHPSKKSIKRLQRINIASCNLNLLQTVRQLMLRFNIVAGIYSKKACTSSYKGQIIKGGINYQLIVSGEQGCKMSELLWGHFEGEKTGRTARCSFYSCQLCLPSSPEN
jgi:intein/homing endonuclease